MSSDTHGATWSEPKDITMATKALASKKLFRVGRLFRVKVVVVDSNGAVPARLNLLIKARVLIES